MKLPESNTSPDERLLEAVFDTDRFMPIKSKKIFDEGGALFDSLLGQYIIDHGGAPKGDDAAALLAQVEQQYPGFSHTVNTHSKIFNRIKNAGEG